MSRTRLAKAIVATTAFMAIGPGGAPAAGAQAGCVGTFSSYFAQQGLRDEVAHRYINGNQPYSFVAQFHGDLEACDEQTH
jgi:hypothetical protein